MDLSINSNHWVCNPTLLHICRYACIHKDCVGRRLDPRTLVQGVHILSKVLTHHPGNVWVRHWINFNLTQHSDPPSQVLILASSTPDVGVKPTPCFEVPPEPLDRIPDAFFSCLVLDEHLQPFEAAPTRVLVVRTIPHVEDGSGHLDRLAAKQVVLLLVLALDHRRVADDRGLIINDCGFVDDDDPLDEDSTLRFPEPNLECCPTLGDSKLLGEPVLGVHDHITISSHIDLDRIAVFIENFLKFELLVDYALRGLVIPEVDVSTLHELAWSAEPARIGSNVCCTLEGFSNDLHQV